MARALPSPSVRWRTALVAAAILAILAACNRPAREVSLLRGVALSSPMAKPALVLRDMRGEPFDLIASTHDKVVLVFFGYTYCPDICPLHMANIAAVLKRMPLEDRSRVVTVFVTTDPERDTPERLRAWLGNFDPNFVGLTGPAEELMAAQAMFGLRQAEREYVTADSANYLVSHAAQVFAFARDGNAYTIYPFGIRQDDWANDIPVLARDASGSEIRRALAPAARAGQQRAVRAAPSDVSMRGVFVALAVVPEPATQDVAAAYLVIRNDTPQEDTLIAVAADLAVTAELHETMGTGEMRHMMPVRAVPLPAGMETRMAPGGTHIMLHTLRRPLKAGDSVTLYLSLARAGALEARAVVVPYAELEKALAGGGPGGS
jgi:protein SCO1/2